MDADQRLDQRRRVHHALASRLAAMSVSRSAAVLTRGPDPSRASLFANASEVIEVDGAKVFVKKIALTDLERSAGERRWLNLFDLPLFCRYELDGAWRELSACSGQRLGALGRVRALPARPPLASAAPHADAGYCRA